MRTRRRRGLLLLSLALASGGLAASQVRERERSVEEKVGPLVPVVVASRELPEGKRLRHGDTAVKRVPARYVPPDALGAPGSLTGAHTAVPVAAGSYLTAGLLATPAAAGGGPLRHGERAVEVAVAGGGLGGGGLGGAGPGSRVDVLVSTEAPGRTSVALEDVELLGLRPGGVEAGLGGAVAGAEAGSGDPAAEPGTAALATLRVTARQAVHLTAADTFGRELRLLVRPPGDRRRSGPVAVGEGDL